MFKLDGPQRKLFKKVVWTCISMPILYKTWWAYGWQMERKVWKENLIEERSRKLSHEADSVSVE